MTPGIRVLTVDDQAVFRGIAREVVDATSGVESVGDAATRAEALAAAARLDPQLVLLDVRMPGLDGIEVARRLRATHPDTLLVSSPRSSSRQRRGSPKRIWREHRPCAPGVRLREPCARSACK